MNCDFFDVCYRFDNLLKLNKDGDIDINMDEKYLELVKILNRR